MKLLIVLAVFAYLAIGMFINGLIDESVNLLFMLFWPLIIAIAGPFYILGWLYELGQKIRGRMDRSMDGRE